MERASVLTQRSAGLSLRRTADPAALSSWLLAVALIVYLGVRQGGYDVVTGSQVAIVAWWLILLLLVSGLIRAQLSRAGWVGLVLIAAYAAWTTLSLTWTESAQDTMTDVSQMLLYVALMALVLLVRGREAIRFMLHGLAVGIVAIAVLALLSRLRFEWFSVTAVSVALPSSRNRLSYPIEYWNALAALVAMGIPILLYSAGAARTLLARSAAAACLPLLALCAYLTASRGGVIEIAVGLALFIVLAPERLSKLATITVAGAGSALLVASADQRSALRHGLRDGLAARQGDQLIVIAVAVVVGVGLLVAAITLIERHVERPRLLVISRRRLTELSLGALAILLAAFFAAGGSGFVASKWKQFKSPASVSATSANAFARLQSSGGEGRYQYWQVAARTANAKPLTGSGANTFQYEWLQHGTRAGGFVIDAHSLYLQALGDLGYPGLVLISAFILWILGYGIWRVVRTRDPAVRLMLAAATAGAFAFAFSAAIDWIWFIPVLPVAFFICAAVIFAPESAQTAASAAGSSRRKAPSRRRIAVALRAAGALVCVAAIAMIALPLAGTEAVRASQSADVSGNLSVALADARAATAVQPYSSAGWLQAALVDEQAGNLRTALADAQHARRLQPVNWQIWYVLTRLEARTGHASAAVADYRHMDWLNPHNLGSL
jgi:O-antigen ligase